MSLGTVYDDPRPGETVSDIFVATNLVSNSSGRPLEPAGMVVDRLDILVSVPSETTGPAATGNVSDSNGAPPSSSSLQVDGSGFAVRVWIAVNRPRGGVGPFNASIGGFILAHDAPSLMYARREVLSFRVPDGRPVRGMTGSQFASPADNGYLRTSVDMLYVVTGAPVDDPVGAYVAGSSVFELNPGTLAWRLLTSLPCCGAIYAGALHMRAGMATLPYVGGATPPPSPSSSLTPSQTRTSSATPSASPTAAAFMLGVYRVRSSAADAAGLTGGAGSGASASASPSTSAAPAATVPASVAMAAAAASACEAAAGGLPCVSRSLPPVFATLHVRGCPATSPTTMLTCSSSAPELVLVAPGDGIARAAAAPTGSVSSGSPASSFGTAVPCPFQGASQGVLPFTVAVYANPMATDAAAAAAAAAAAGGAFLDGSGAAPESAGDSPVQITCRVVSPGRGGPDAAPLVASASWAVAYRHDGLPVMHDVLLYWPAQRLLRSARFGGTVRLGASAVVGSAADGNCSNAGNVPGSGSGPSALPSPSASPRPSASASPTPSRSVSATRKASVQASPLPPAPACLSEAWVRQQLPTLQAQVQSSAQAQARAQVLPLRVLAATVAGAPLAIIIGARANGSSAVANSSLLPAAADAISGAALASRAFGAPGDTSVSIGGRRARILWASSDGAMMHVSVPPELCAAAGAGASGGCGRQRLVLERSVLPRRLLAQADFSEASNLAATNASIAVACPPACPGVGSGDAAFAFVPAPSLALAASSASAPGPLAIGGSTSSSLAVSSVGVAVAAWPDRGAGSDAPLLLAAPPPDGAPAAVSTLESSAGSALSVGADGTTTTIPTSSSAAAGLFFVFACPGATNPAIDAEACRNASHPLFSGCMWGDGSAAAPCSSCPPNALCPGGRRLWPQAGYYASSEYANEVLPCAPSPPESPRCLRWDDAAGAVECGPAYQPGSYGCLLCLEGTYPVDAADAVTGAEGSGSTSNSGGGSSSSGGGGCAPCGSGSALLQLLIRAASVAGVLAAAAAAAFGLLTLLARCMRTSVAGGALRFLDLLLFLFIAVQVVAEAGTNAGAAGELPAPARAVLRVAAAFAFEGIALHHACLRGLPPFLAEKLLFSAILIGEAVVISMAAAAVLRRRSANDGSGSGGGAALCCSRRRAAPESDTGAASTSADVPSRRGRSRPRGRQPRILRAVSRRFSAMMLKMGSGNAAPAAAPVSAWEPGGGSSASAAGDAATPGRAAEGAAGSSDSVRTVMHAVGSTSTSTAVAAAAGRGSAPPPAVESPRAASILDGKGAKASSAASHATAPASRRQPRTVAGCLRCCASGVKAVPSLLCSKIRAQLGYAICFALSVLYGRTAGTAFALLRCESVTMTLAQAAALDGADAAALTAAAVEATTSGSSGGIGSGSGSSSDGAPLVTVSLLQSNPTFICYAGAHTAAAGLAWFVVAAFLLGFPIFAVAHASAAKAALLRDGAPPDAVSAFLLTATYRPRRWFMKLGDMASLAALAALAALWREPTSPAGLGGRAAARCAVLLVGAVALLIARPYAPGEAWRLPLRVAAAVLACLVAVTTAVASMRALPPASRQSLDDDALRAAAGGLSYTLLAGAAAFVLAAVVSVGWAMLRGAYDEARIAARLRAAEASEAASLARGAPGGSGGGGKEASSPAATTGKASHSTGSGTPGAAMQASISGADLYRATQLYAILADAAPSPSESSSNSSKGARGGGSRSRFSPLRAIPGTQAGGDASRSATGKSGAAGAVPAFTPAGAASRHVSAAAALLAGRDVESGSRHDNPRDADDVTSRLRMPMHQWRLLAAAAAASAERTGGHSSGVSDGILRALATYGGGSPASFAPVPAAGAMMSRRERIAAAERAQMSAAGESSSIDAAAAAAGRSSGGSFTAAGPSASARRESFVAFRNPLSA